MLLDLVLGLSLLTPGAPCASPPARVDDPEPEVVKFETKDKLSLAASYYPPRSEERKAPAALLVHDAGADRSQLKAIAERLQRQGFAVLLPDLRGHGESASEDCAWDPEDQDAMERLWAFAPRDLEAAVIWLRGRREVNTTNINLVGVRAGCSLAVYHAKNDENVRSIVLIEPRAEQLGFDMLSGFEEIAGLPVCLFAPRAKREAAEAMVSFAHESAGGLEFIDLTIQRSSASDCLEDKALPSSIARWLKEKAFPRRGRD